MHETEKPYYMTIAELAKRFRLSQNKARALAEEEIGAIRLGRAIRVPLALVEEYEAKKLSK